jgi:hypothetical protein
MSFTYRRVVEIDTQGETNLFRTIRLDSDTELDDAGLIAGFADILDDFSTRYETQVWFVPAASQTPLEGYVPELPDEENWHYPDRTEWSVF